MAGKAGEQRGAVGGKGEEGDNLRKRVNEKKIERVEEWYILLKGDFRKRREKEEKLK